MKHVKEITKRPVQAAEDSDVDLDFIIASLTFGLTVLSGLQTKKASQASDG